MTQEEINDLRIFALNMQHFLPLLEKKKSAAFGRLLQQFNAGSDVMRELSRVAALHELETEIKGKLRTLDAQSEEKL